MSHWIIHLTIFLKRNCCSRNHTLSLSRCYIWRNYFMTVLYTCVVRMIYRHTTSTMSFSDANLLLFTTPLPLPHEKPIYSSDACLGITLSSRSPVLFTYFSPAVLCSPGSLEIRACGEISAKLYYVACCMFRNTFKVKYPMISAKSKVIFIWWFALKGSIAL